MQSSETTKAIMPALLKAQQAMPSPDLDMKGKYGKYASLKETLRCARPALNDQGILIMQPPAGYDVERKCFMIETRLVHAESGEWVSCVVDIPLERATAHGVGSAITYAKRYGLSSLCGMVADEDDDGTGATREGGKRPSAQRETPKPKQSNMSKEKREAIDSVKEHTGKTGAELTDAVAEYVQKVLGELPDKVTDDQWVRVRAYVEQDSTLVTDFAGKGDDQ
jgi:hypothetical protein